MFNFFRRLAVKKQVKYLEEKRPLPLGRKEFEFWSSEIHKLSEVPGQTLESARFALGEMICHVPPNQSFESYGWFVHRLRKVCANQVGLAIAREIKEAQLERIKDCEETTPKLVTPSDEKVLEDPKIQSAKK